MKSWVEELIASRRILKAVALAVQGEGFKLGVLIRMTPIISTTILDYLFAAVGVRFPVFFASIGLGMIPLSFIGAYMGSLADDLAQVIAGGGERSLTETILVIAGFGVSSVIIIAIMSFIGKREITKALALLDAQEALQAPSEEGAVSTSTEGDLEEEGGISLDDIVLRPFGHLQQENEIDMTPL